MPQVFVLAGRDVGRSYELTHGALAGRSPSAQVRLHDRSISREHVRFEFRGGRWFAVDLNSRNGLFVGSARVPEVALNDLDEIRLGDLPLRFRDESPGSAPEPTPRPAPASRSDSLVALALDSPAGASASEEGDEGGIVLEEEIDLSATEVRPRAGVRRIQLEEEPEQEQDEEEEELSERDLRRAAILREGRGADGGLLSGDLSQQPLLMRALVYLLVGAFFVGVCYGAYLLVAQLRGA